MLNCGVMDIILENLIEFTRVNIHKMILLLHVLNVPMKLVDELAPPCKNAFHLGVGILGLTSNGASGFYYRVTALTK